MKEESKEIIESNKRSEKLVENILSVEKKRAKLNEPRRYIEVHIKAERLVKAILSFDKFKNKNQTGYFSYKGDSDIDLDHFLIGLIYSLTLHYGNKELGVDLDLIDLVQECSIALERSLDKFDPEMGFELPIYVYWWIVQGLKNAIDREKANQSS